MSDKSENVADLQQIETLSFERVSAERVKAMLEMGFGSLHIKGGADTMDAMMEGTFEYGDASYKPEVSYDVKHGLGQLVVRQPQDRSRSGPEKKSSWNVAFSKTIPLDLALKVASGTTSVDLSDMQLTALKSKVASGRLATSLTGSMDSLEHVSFQTASGRTQAVLNGSFSRLADCTVSSASGIVTLALGGTFPMLDTLDLKTASGPVDLGLTGHYPALGCVSVDTVSGTADLNFLEGAFSDLRVVLNCVSGEHIIRCPRDIGVGLHFKSLTGQIKAPALRRIKGIFVNDLYGEAETTLEIAVSSVSGRVFVQLGNT